MTRTWLLETRDRLYFQAFLDLSPFTKSRMCPTPTATADASFCRAITSLLQAHEPLRWLLLLRYLDDVTSFPANHAGRVKFEVGTL